MRDAGKDVEGDLSAILARAGCLDGRAAPDEQGDDDVFFVGRLFRVEFDLSRPVAPPPAPWGG